MTSPEDLLFQLDFKTVDVKLKTLSSCPGHFKYTSANFKLVKTDVLGYYRIVIKDNDTRTIVFNIFEHQYELSISEADSKFTLLINKGSLNSLVFSGLTAKIDKLKQLHILFKLIFKGSDKCSSMATSHQLYHLSDPSAPTSTLAKVMFESNGINLKISGKGTVKQGRFELCNKLNDFLIFISDCDKKIVFNFKAKYYKKHFDLSGTSFRIYFISKGTEEITEVSGKLMFCKATERLKNLMDGILTTDTNFFPERLDTKSLLPVKRSIESNSLLGTNNKSSKFDTHTGPKLSLS